MLQVAAMGMGPRRKGKHWLRGPSAEGREAVPADSKSVETMPIVAPIAGVADLPEAPERGFSNSQGGIPDADIPALTHKKEEEEKKRGGVPLGGVSSSAGNSIAGSSARFALGSARVGGGVAADSRRA